MTLTWREKLIIKLIQWLREKLTFDPESGRVVWVRYAGRYQGDRAIEGRMSLHYGPGTTDENIIGSISMTPEMFGYTVKGMDEVQRGLWGVAGLDAEPESKRAEDGVDIVAILNTTTARFLARGHVSGDEIEIWNVDRDENVPHPVLLQMAQVHGRLAKKLYSQFGLNDEWDDEETDE